MKLHILQEINQQAEGDAPADGNNSSEDAHNFDACPAGQTEKQGIDPFRSEENDPSKSNAMRKFLDYVTRTTMISLSF